MSKQPISSDTDGPHNVSGAPTEDRSKNGETSSNAGFGSSDEEYDSGHHHKIPPHRFLTHTEWVRIAHSIGGIKDDEQLEPSHPTHWCWPPKGMRPGLYKDVVTERAKFFYLYHGSSITRWTLMISQLLVGAALTAIGSMSFKDGLPITILGAVNTVIAGLLALITNSGLPDRYRYDMAQFAEVEDHIKEILESGVAPKYKTAEQIVAECFDLYKDAKATVAANMPANYTSKNELSSPKTSGSQSGSKAPGARSRSKKEGK